MLTTTESPIDTLRNPFPGLRPFREDESHLYFGRTKQVAEVKDKLLQNHFVAIIGTSGIGKSSFIRCGLFPEIHNNVTTTHSSTWKVYKMSPGNAPIERLAQALQRQDKDEQNQDSTLLSLLLEKGLAEAIKHVDESDALYKNHLIFVDQFEELFRYRETDKDTLRKSAKFVELLNKAVEQSTIPIFVVLTMRSDFIGDCSQFPKFTEKINSSQFLIPYMTREEKREAIVGPIEVAGGAIDEDLVTRILDDVGEKLDHLPVMQHALMRTWDAWRKHNTSDNKMSIPHYESIGTIQNALSVHANEAYNELDPTQKNTCEKVFRAIIEITNEGKKVRRPAMITEISDIIGASPEEIRTVVNQFRRVDRGLLMPPPEVELRNDHVIDISHESLIRIWQTLDEWIQREEEARKTYLRLAENAELHHKGQAGLLQPPELHMFLAWRKEHKPSKTWGLKYHPTYERTMWFLEGSKRAHERDLSNQAKRQKRDLIRSRIIAAIFFFGAIVAGIFGFYAFLQSQIAEDKAKEAIEKEQLALSEKKRADDEKKKAEKQKLAALDAKERARLEARKARINELLAEEQKRKALDASERARQQAVIAQLNKEKADIDRMLAQMAEQEARKANALAEKLQLLSVAQSMAIKSRQMTDTADEKVMQKVLVAKQAYNFHTKSEGRPNHPDIYNGLYYALKSIEGDDFNELQGHTANVRTLAPAQGNKVYSAGSDGQIILWNSDSRRKIDTLNQIGRIHRTLAYDAQSGALACAGNYPFIQLLSANNLRAEARIIPVAADQVWYLEFASSNVLVTADQKGIISVWNLKETNLKKPLKQSNEQSEKIEAIAVRGSQIAVARGSKVSLINYLESMQEIPLLNQSSKILSLAFSEDGKLATGNSNGIVSVFNLKGTQIGTDLKGHSARVNNLCFSKDGTQLASASFDKTVKIWNIATSKNYDDPPISLDDHRDWVWSVTFSPDGKKLLAGCRDFQVRAWPTQVEDMANLICPSNFVDRNMTKKEWERFVAPVTEIHYELTCEANPLPDDIKEEDMNGKLTTSNPE